MIESELTRYRLALDKADAIRRAPPVVMTLLEAAAYVACSPRQLRYLIHGRRVKCARVGNRVVFKRAWLDEFLDSSAE